MATQFVETHAVLHFTGPLWVCEVIIQYFFVGGGGGGGGQCVEIKHS